MFERLGLDIKRIGILAAFAIIVIGLSVFIAMRQGLPAYGASYVPEEMAYGATRAPFVESARDTLPDTGPIPLESAPLDPDFVMLYENEYMAFYYREERNVFAIRDKRIDYVWKTGLDAPFPSQMDDFVRGLTDDELATMEIYRVVRMSDPFIAMANSVITIEFFNEANAPIIRSSASRDGVNTSLSATAAPNRFIMTSVFPDIDLTINVHITFEGTRVIFDIPNEEVTGTGRRVLSAIHITPFLGATGGVIEHFDPVRRFFDADNREALPMIPGYFFVPDGSGALIRFNYNYMSFSEYRGFVFGPDYGQSQFFEMEASNHVPLQNPAMPVFGVSHGNGWAGFVAFATNGEEYMEIVAMPHQNTTYYNFIYPRFVYNRIYLHVYDRRGSGFFTRPRYMSDFDVTMVYEFLAYTDGQLACYVGMAQAYRRHLLETGQLVLGGSNPGVRVDFLMSDISPNIVSHTQIALTTADHVQNILEELDSLGVENITTNLFGWQRDGITGGRPGTVSFRGSIGSRSDFTQLGDFARQNGMRLAFAQEYFVINREQMMFLNNAAIHLSGQHITTDISNIVPGAAPVTEQAYARPERSVAWLESDLQALGFLDYHMITGISSRVISDHTGQGITVQESRALLEEAFEAASQTHGLFLHRANQFLFRFASAYMDMPVFSSQHIIQTDTVPFLQMVLHGAMDMFSPYANFSFYTERDVLRMIDYNVNPSFIITHNPSHLLQHTNSAHFFTTEYGRYRDLIVEVSAKVQGVLSQVAGYEWINRQVYISGVVVNSYRNAAGGTRQIIINYTDYDVYVNGSLVPAVNAVVI